MLVRDPCPIYRVRGTRQVSLCFGKAVSSEVAVSVADFGMQADTAVHMAGYLVPSVQPLPKDAVSIAFGFGSTSQLDVDSLLSLQQQPTEACNSAQEMVTWIATM